VLEVTRDKMIAARDRALRAATQAKSVEDGQAQWLLARLHHRLAKELGGAGAVGRESTGQPLAAQGAQGIGRDW
jgi:hypothetical protein